MVADKGLQDVDAAVDERMERSTLRLFKGSKAVEAGSDDNSDSEDEIPYYVHDNLVEIISSRDTKIDQLSIGESFATIKEIV